MIVVSDQGPPEDVIERAVRLTRRARTAVSIPADRLRAERDRTLAAHGFVARVRDAGSDPVLVCYPAAWIDDDGVVRPDRIDDRDRAIERPVHETEPTVDFDRVDAHNRTIVADVEAAGGPVHAANAAAFADFMGNHYVKPVEAAADDEVVEFLEEYFPRNAWPADDQRAVVEESLRAVFEAAGRAEPPVLDDATADRSG